MLMKVDEKTQDTLMTEKVHNVHLMRLESKSPAIQLGQ